MKKQEVLKFLEEKNVKSTNVRSFLRTKKNKTLLGVNNQNLEKTIEKFSQWLEEKETDLLNKAIAEINKKEAKRLNISIKKLEEIEQKSSKILECFHTGHSMGCYRELIATKRNKLSFTKRHNSTLHEYANSSRYRATYGDLRLRISFQELEKLEKIEGIWTIKTGKGKAKWLEERGSKQYHQVIWVEGWLYKDSHSTVSFAAAKLLQRKKDELLKQKELTEKELIQQNKRFVGVKHIKALGACDAGIKAFCQRHNLNSENGYNLGYLKSLNDSYATRYLNSL